MGIVFRYGVSALFASGNDKAILFDPRAIFHRQPSVTPRAPQYINELTGGKHPVMVIFYRAHLFS